MKNESVFIKVSRAASLLIWAVVVLLPLLVLFISSLNPDAKVKISDDIYSSLFRSLVLSAIIAGVSILLGWIPGRLFGTCHARRDLLLLLLLMPLVLPRYVLYYAWWLLLSPTTSLGAYLSGKTELAKFIGTSSTTLVLIMWYWPLAALLLGQGWRNIDRRIWDSASLDAGNLGIFRNITLPLLGRPVLLAFGTCFILSLSEFATFHLAGVKTIGTELSVLYQLTHSEAALARASRPVAIAALILAVILGKNFRTWISSNEAIGTIEQKSQRGKWIVLVLLVGVSLLIPVLLLIYNVSDIVPFKQFLILHYDDLLWSFAISFLAAGLAYIIAYGAFSLGNTAQMLRSTDVQNPQKKGACAFMTICSYIRIHILPLIVCSSIFLVMFLPASIIAVSILKFLAVLNFPMSIRQGWFIVSIGLASRFAGVALILLLLARYSQGQTLSEMALVDGASQFQIFRHIHLPHIWPLLTGAFIMIIMFSMTELAATMILLPPGLPNFAQRLLNQMHYARDQQVIASCLILISFFLLMTLVLVLLLRLVRLRWLAFVLVFCVCLFAVSGCDDDSSLSGRPDVINEFGKSGQGPGEFEYPRAIDIADDGSVYVVDKTGRIQKFSPNGKFIDAFDMPQIESGKPTGISFGPDGNLYVADTHYYRVLVFSPNGEIIRQWGKFGKDNGCFIYPTDVAFSGDGRIFVSEYGGNDRISVFNEQGDFLYAFGSSGSGQGQLSRPSALCVDKSRKRLYAVDACNHRIAVYDFNGTLIEYFGTAGLDAGQLRYPYGLALLKDGTLVVCEFGNNRIQLFSPAGQSVGVYGKAGRQSGELAYPWGAAVNKDGDVYVVDAGNNRIQVWRL
ncbi:MAG: 6-bladed beta-propeller [Sedimentisphaerales bacterium]|nr:6-bladed beta-propeller [Sedimentisphaerales bacterium]